MNSRRVQYYGFEANGVEVQLHVDVRMRQKAGTQTTKIKSAKSFVEVHPRKFIPLEIYPLYGCPCGLESRLLVLKLWAWLWLDCACSVDLEL